MLLYSYFQSTKYIGPASLYTDSYSGINVSSFPLYSTFPSKTVLELNWHLLLKVILQKKYVKFKKNKMSKFVFVNNKSNVKKKTF